MRIVICRYFRPYLTSLSKIAQKALKFAVPCIFWPIIVPAGFERQGWNGQAVTAWDAEARISDQEGEV